MGDFDRKQTGEKKDQGKQVTMVIALGVVLMGVVGWQFMKAGPQPAQGAAGIPGAGPVGALVPEGLTPDQVRAALLQDPTSTLLRESTPASGLGAKNPGSPFVMDANWRSKLVKEQVIEVKPVAPRSNDTPRDPVPVVIVPKGVTLGDYKLTSILRVGDKPSAVINGRILSEGQVVDGARIVEIRDDRVVLQNSKFYDGPTITIGLEPRNR